jgi:hypothetical protein
MQTAFLKNNHTSKVQFISRVTLFLMIASLTGCLTAPQSLPSVDAIQAESVFQSENDALMVRFQKHTVQAPVEALSFFCGLASRISGTKPQCALVQSIEGEKKSLWFPSGALFISLAQVRKLKLESEVAALLAIQLAHQKKGHLFERFSKGETGLDFTSEQKVDAVEEAVQLMYAAGYDPRTLLTYLKIVETNPSDLEKMVEKGRRAIAQKPPLRNPILKSEEFSRIQRGLNKL